MEDIRRATRALPWSIANVPTSLLAGFLDAVPAQAAILDHDGAVIAVNAAWRRFAEQNGGDPEGWVGLNYLKVACQAEDENARIIAGGLKGVLSGGLNSFEHEYPCHSPTCLRWFRCLISALPGDTPAETGAAVLHVDITAQKQAEAHALAASRAKSEFLASLSHELRTPLNAILGFSEMIGLEIWGALGDPRYKGYAEDIHHAGKHLLSLINEVLDLSKIEAGKFLLREEETEVAGLVTQCAHMMEDRAHKEGLSLTVHVEPDLPSLRADGRIMRQVLLNLLSNAVKFTPSGGSITVEAMATPDGWLRLAVSDTGIGIAAGDLARVMEPFGQVDSDQARLHSAESTGLGLPLAKRFVELHGGRLVIDSKPGEGTSVAALLPAARLVARG